MSGAVLAVFAGCAWAANILGVRWALPRSSSSPAAGALFAIVVAAAIALAAALTVGGARPATSALLGFALVGAIAPGLSQGLFVSSVDSIGPSRTIVIVGMAPMFAALLAIAVLGEPLRSPVLIGTTLTVSGGAIVGWERGIPMARSGVVLAVVTAVSFAVRDVVARSVSLDTDVGPIWTGAVVLSAAAVVMLVISASTMGPDLAGQFRLAFPWFGPSGLMLAIALPLTLLALDRGRVGVVAPVTTATQITVTVVVGSMVFGRAERAPRVLVALVLVVVGGTLVATSS